jgi:ATP-dependent DNA ligase
MAFQPMPLFRRPLPFEHPEWIFELKYDGFRSLAVVQNDRTQLISRNGQPLLQPAKPEFLSITTSLD